MIIFVIRDLHASGQKALSSLPMFFLHVSGQKNPIFKNKVQIVCILGNIELHVYFR
jgi:hypothetical protein